MGRVKALKEISESIDQMFKAGASRKQQWQSMIDLVQKHTRTIDYDNDR